jgi:hypothetical protein
MNKKSENKTKVEGGVNMKNSIVITIIAVIVVGGLAFYGGIQYGAQSRRSAFTGQFAGAGGTRGGAAGSRTGGFRPVTGDIISNDTNSITVKLADGSSKIVLLSDSTSINKADKASVSDLTVGQKVAVIGQTNSDGSVMAQSIQLNPIQRQGGNPNPNQGQNPTPAQ